MKAAVLNAFGEALKIETLPYGLIDLRQFDLAEFALDDANDAVAYAAANSGPRELTVLRP
ncbi:hypothetical protein [Phenylobacterium sp.]|jgi:alcohol dehydrogenase|uniref:hypothetical protein n=1 Tax=Phenylobacterium sp. TaxID=1871053 RepID=UPI002F427399